MRHCINDAVWIAPIPVFLFPLSPEYATFLFFLILNVNARAMHVGVAMHSVFSMRANSLTNLLAGQNRIDIGAAVNVEFSAGDKGRVVRSQIGNQAGYLVGLRKALEGNVRLECLGKAAKLFL